LIKGNDKEKRRRKGEGTLNLIYKKTRRETGKRSGAEKKGTKLIVQWPTSEKKKSDKAVKKRRRESFGLLPFSEALFPFKPLHPSNPF